MGADFRVAYQEISTLRARLPDHTTIVALSAKIVPGRQYAACIRALGLKFKNFHLEKRDCEHRNIDLIIRPIPFITPTNEFAIWTGLVPTLFSKASESIKRLLFIQGIDDG